MNNLLSSLFLWLRAWVCYNLTYLGLRYYRHYSPVQARILAVDGLMTAPEVLLLYQQAREARGGAIVEIGSFHGRSTIALALGSQEGHGAPVYTIDPYVSFTGPLGGKFGPQDKIGLLNNLLFTATVPRVWLIQLPSGQVARGWQEPISLLWIDGDHSYEGVKDDFEAWTPFVIPGGIIAFHDSIDHRLGPYKLISEILAKKNFEHSMVFEKITLIKKLF
jgi:hypothetical protein